MIDNLVFLNEHWLVPVSVIAICLWFLLLWKEYAQAGTKRLLLKALAAMVAVLAMALMVLQPVTQQTISKKEGILLTSGYLTKDLDSLKEANGTNKILEYTPNKILQPELDSLETITILGNGVETYDLWQFANRNTTFRKGDLPSGITRLKYNRKLTKGDALLVEFAYQNALENSSMLLVDPAGNVKDSVFINKGNTPYLSLKSDIQVSGNFIYNLIEKDSLGAERFQNPIPVTVEPKKRLQILIVNNFPTFETKYLKNYLAEAGHEILVRSQLTTNTYKFENLNRSRGSIYGLTQSNLEEFDLLIIDTPSFINLSRASQQALQGAIEEDGLGVFLQPGEGLYTLSRKRTQNKSNRLFPFQFTRDARKISFKNYPKVIVPRYDHAFAKDIVLQPVVSATQADLAAKVTQGNGAIVTTILRDTYQWILEGNEKLYDEVWSRILTEVAKPEWPVAVWESEHYLAYQNEPFSFTLQTKIENPEVFYQDKTRVAIAGNPTQKELWEGKVYPNQSGWQTLRVGQDSLSQFHFYVPEKEVWQTLRTYEKLKANERFFNNQRLDQSSTATQTTTVNRLWFLLLFIVGIGFLWFEPRYLSQ